MSGFLQGQTTAENEVVKRFGFLISAVFLILTVLAMLIKSVTMPWLFLITMYLLTGSLWTPILIRPLYKLFGKYLVPEAEKEVKEKAHDSQDNIR